MTQYRVLFHKKPEPGAAFRWDIAGVIVSAESESSAVETARANLTLDSNWYLRQVENLETSAEIANLLK